MTCDTVQPHQRRPGAVPPSDCGTAPERTPRVLATSWHLGQRGTERAGKEPCAIVATVLHFAPTPTPPLAHRRMRHYFAPILNQKLKHLLTYGPTNNQHLQSYNFCLFRIFRCSKYSCRAYETSAPFEYERCGCWQNGSWGRLPAHDAV